MADMCTRWRIKLKDRRIGVLMLNEPHMASNGCYAKWVIETKVLDGDRKVAVDRLLFTEEGFEALFTLMIDALKHEGKIR